MRSFGNRNMKLPCCHLERPSHTTCTCLTARILWKPRLSDSTFAALRTSRGARVVLLPTIPYGTQTNMQAFPLAMNLNPSTLTIVVGDLLESLVNSGISKVLLLNSHGGNTLKPLLRELAGETEAELFLCDWYQSIRDVYDTIFERPEDHAGEMETSFALAWFGHLVARDKTGALLADEGAKRPFRLAALNQGWVSMTRPWHLLTTNSGAGNPRNASAEKGQQLMQVLVRRLSQFLVELSEAELDETFPFVDDSGGGGDHHS